MKAATAPQLGVNFLIKSSAESPIQHFWSIPTEFTPPTKSTTRPRWVHLSPSTSTKYLPSQIQKCPECLLWAERELKHDPSLPPNLQHSVIVHPPLFIHHPSSTSSLFSTSAEICSSLIEAYTTSHQLVEQLELGCMQDAAHYVCVIGHAQMQHLCREEQWEMMLCAPSQEYPSHSWHVSASHCTYTQACTAEDVEDFFS